MENNRKDIDSLACRYVYWALDFALKQHKAILKCIINWTEYLPEIRSTDSSACPLVDKPNFKH